MGTYAAVLKIPRQKAEKFSSKSQSDKKTSKKSFPSNWSYGHVEFSFDNRTEFFLTEGQNFFKQSPKLMNKNTNFSKWKNFDSNVSLNIENAALTTPPEHSRQLAKLFSSNSTKVR